MATRRIVHRRQDNGFSNPVEPTLVQDLPTTSNTINFSSLHPTAGTGDEGDSSSDPTLFAQTTFPTLTGTDLITFTGTNVVSGGDNQVTTRAVETSSATVTTTGSESESSTASADDAETTTDTEDAAPTAGPGKAAAGVAALLGLAAVL